MIYQMKEMRKMMKILKTLKLIINKIWKYYYSHWVDLDRPDGSPKLDKLRWLPNKITTDKHMKFGPIDTIQFDIKNMPMKEEVIFEMSSIKEAKEVVSCVAQHS